MNRVLVPGPFYTNHNLPSTEVKGMVVEPVTEQNQLGIVSTPVFASKDGAECTIFTRICQMPYIDTIQWIHWIDWIVRPLAGILPGAVRGPC
jgi:hypothetical protein